MLITNHVVAGAVIGAFVPRPTTAFGLGVVSHFALDATPHWGHPDHSTFLKVAVVDGLVGLATMTMLARAAAPERRAAVVAGMLGSCFPDSDKPWDLFVGGSPFPAWVDHVHKRIQNEAHERMPYEALVGLLGAFVARRLVRG